MRYLLFMMLASCAGGYETLPNTDLIIYNDFKNGVKCYKVQGINGLSCLKIEDKK